MGTSPAGTKVAGLTGTEAAVLGMLAVGGDRSGYELYQCARGGVGYIWAPARSRIYAVLPGLAEAGLVSARGVRQEDRPDKVVYRITRRGEAALRAWLDADEPWSHDAFLLRVFFGALMTPEQLIALVERHREEERARLDEYRTIEAEIADNPADRFGYLTLRWGMAAARARIRWADETLRTLRREEP